MSTPLTPEMVEIEVEVTADDIEKGKTRRCRQCPIALAVNRHLRKKFEASVGVVDFSIRQRGVCDPNGLWQIEKLPEVARAFLKAFDDGEKVLPFTFALNLRRHCVREECLERK